MNITQHPTSLALLGLQFLATLFVLGGRLCDPGAGAYPGGRR